MLSELALSTEELCIKGTRGAKALEAGVMDRPYKDRIAALIGRANELRAKIQKMDATGHKNYFDLSQEARRT